MGKGNRKQRAQQSARPSQPYRARRDVFARVRSAVVGIAVTPPPPPGGDVGEFVREKITLIGSGFMMSSDGFGVTAGHVVDDWLAAVERHRAGQGPAPERLRALIHTVVAAREAGTYKWAFGLAAINVIRRSKTLDLAAFLLGARPPERAQLAVLPASRELVQEGDVIAACGYPLGRKLHKDIMGGVIISPSFSQGIVSATLPYPGAPPKLAQVFQLDAVINPGNSGGPVFDPATGAVVGVVTSANIRKYELPPATPSAKPTEIVIPVGLARAHHVHWAIELVDELRREVRPAQPPAGQ